MTASIATEPAGRWGQLAILSTTMFLALVPWFSAAAVAPLVADSWGISGVETAFLTVAVQVGFAIGALVIAFTGAADAIPARHLMAGGALVAAAANAAFGLYAVDLATGLPLRSPERGRDRGRLPSRAEGRGRIVRAAGAWPWAC